MIIKIDKVEAKEIMVRHLETIFPNVLIVATESYGDFEFDLSKKEAKE